MYFYCKTIIIENIQCTNHNMYIILQKKFYSSKYNNKKRDDDHIVFKQVIGNFFQHIMQKSEIF